MDNVKKHEYVRDNDEARPIIIKALSFLYELDEIGKREIEVEKNSTNFFTANKCLLLTDGHPIHCNS